MSDQRYAWRNDSALSSRRSVIVLIACLQAQVDHRILVVGQPLEGRITESAAEVHTTTLDSRYTKAPTVGHTYSIRVEEPGVYSFEMRSYFFDAYLVLRDDLGELVAEDDDGLVGTHSYFARSIESGRDYYLDACALHGARGAYELRLTRGMTAPSSPVELARAKLEDARERVDVLDALDGPEGEPLLRAVAALGFLYWQQGRYEEAHPLMERALAMSENVLGPEHPITGSALGNLAAQLEGLGDDAGARPLYERALVVFERAHGPVHPQVAWILGALGKLLVRVGRHAEARPLLERALAISEKTPGPETSETALRLAALADLLKKEGELVEARRLCERGLAISEKALGPDHLETGARASNLASVLVDQGEYADALPLLERALAVVETTLGPDHPATATVLGALGHLRWKQQRYDLARPLMERALEITERALGPEHPDVATGLFNLAAQLVGLGDYSAARGLYERALAIREKRLGAKHPDTGGVLDNLSLVLKDLGEYDSARAMSERALAISVELYGPEHRETAHRLNNLAGLLSDQGDYVLAKDLYERALRSQECVFGPAHPNTATSLTNLAVLLREEGNYAAARPLFERALDIRETVFGPDHPEVAMSLLPLSGLLGDQGDHRAAQSKLERALGILERAFGSQHPLTAVCLGNLANALQSQGKIAEARDLTARALPVFEKIGPETRDTASCLHNMALLLDELGEEAAAIPLVERALEVREKIFGSEHAETASTLELRAGLFVKAGDFARARPLLERALAINERAFGSTHPDTTLTRYSIAVLLAELGHHEEASVQARSALEGSLSFAEGSLWALSERERLLFLGRAEHYLELFLTLSRSEGTLLDVESAFELALESRGLVSRGMQASRELLRSRAPATAAPMMENLRGVQAQLSGLLYEPETGDPERRERALASLRQRRNDLEVELQRSLGHGLERSLTPQELRSRLEPGEAFLDFFVLSWVERPNEESGTGKWSEPHLTAWVLPSDREVVFLDLGPAAPINVAVKGWLAELVAKRGLATGSDAQTGDELRKFLWEPVAKHLEGVGRVFVRSDSFLGALPFEVIPLAGGRFLIEEMGFVYVQTPNDLAAKAEAPVSGVDSLLSVGGVDFRRRAEHEKGQGEDVALIAAASMNEELRGSLHRLWSRLPHTENEAQSVGDLFELAFPDAKPLFLSGDTPTEERLKQELPRHSIVHLATHGFFNPAGTVSMWDSAQQAAEKSARRGMEEETRALVGQFPGLLTGLVCAGANEPAPAGRDDGLLTAEEVLWLDLSKVDLVVLSACETALGERRSGEGMIGLRRAFGLAGAKTVVSSLWSVKDRSTSELMQRFYENLWLKKQGRADALRNAQLEMLAKNRATEHDALPSTWGAFVLSGEWR